MAQKYVGIWVRVSTEEQAEGDSPKHHEERAKMYAESRNWTVREVYNLSGVSGKSVMEHPEAQRMLYDIQRGHISALIFSKIARLARNTKQLLEFSDFFQEHHADLVSIFENIDTRSPAGRLFYTIISAMAEWEQEEIASRVKASVLQRAKAGKHMGGIAPYGFRWKGDSLVLHEEEAEVRKLVFELFIDTKRKKRVAAILNERGYRTRTDKRFSDATIKRWLSDPISKGIRRAHTN